MDETGVAPETDDLKPALGDVVFNLTHDLPAAPRNLRDALDFGPVAAAKALSAVALGFAALKTRLRLPWRRPAESAPPRR